MNVGEVMTRDPCTVTSDTSAAEAARLMRDEDVGSLPVVEGRRLVATVTDRDIVVRVVAESRSVETAVGEIASRELVTIDPQQTVDEAMRLMAEHQVRRLPVCEEDGRLVGIISQADVVVHAADERAGATVERISE